MSCIYNNIVRYCFYEKYFHRLVTMFQKLLIDIHPLIIIKALKNVILFFNLQNHPTKLSSDKTI